MILTPALEVMLIIFLVTAVISDFSDHRIPNAITLFAAVVGLSSHLYLGGLQGVGLSMGGLVVGMACLLPFYLLGGMGAGDVKMMGAIGAFVGPEASLFAVAVGLVAGGLGGLGLLLFNGISRHGGRRTEAVSGWGCQNSNVSVRSELVAGGSDKVSSGRRSGLGLERSKQSVERIRIRRLCGLWWLRTGRRDQVCSGIGRCDSQQAA